MAIRCRPQLTEGRTHMPSLSATFRRFSYSVSIFIFSLPPRMRSCRVCASRYRVQFPLDINTGAKAQIPWGNPTKLKEPISAGQHTESLVKDPQDQPRDGVGFRHALKMSPPFALCYACFCRDTDFSFRNFVGDRTADSEVRCCYAA